MFLTSGLHNEVIIMELYDSKIKCTIDDLSNIVFPFNERVGLEIIHNNVKYEFLLNLKKNSDYLIIAGSGARTKEEKKERYVEPLFHRWSWNFNQSIIYYNDPTAYIHGDLLGGWGVGTPDYWPVQIISKILNIIAKNLNFSHENIVFYGSSMGGFISILLATLNKNSYFVADIPQTNFLKHWRWPNIIKKHCFPELTIEEMAERYGYRLNIFELMKHEQYIPKGLLVFDVSFDGDVQHHYNYVFEELSKLSFENYHNELYIRIMGKNKGHYAYNNVQDLLDILYSIKNHKLLIDKDNSEIKNILKLKNSLTLLNDLELKEKLEKYYTGRIDIINKGNKNNILEIINISDEFASVKFPKWFKSNDGSGCVIQSLNQSIDIEFKCIGDGNLFIKLMGVDARNKYDKRLPIYITFTKFFINNKLIFDSNELVWHNKPYQEIIPVKDGEIIILHIEWEPF